MQIDFLQAQSLNQPQVSDIQPGAVTITTSAHTDFWQRSYYGFRNDNAPGLLLPYKDNFSFTAKVKFNYQARFDQCGILVYLDSDNWFKSSIEFEDATLSRLGSVVTNHGHSDWATTDIATTDCTWYRLSRRGPDFLIETSSDGIAFKQMRIFHLHALGATTAEMGRLDPPQPAEQSIPVGVYACSPNVSSFAAHFSECRFEPCLWLAHR